MVDRARSEFDFNPKLTHLHVHRKCSSSVFLIERVELLPHADFGRISSGLEKYADFSGTGKFNTPFGQHVEDQRLTVRDSRVVG